MSNNKTKKIIILGAGFSSLSAACYLKKQGFQVTVIEKNETVGGRARQLKKEGFTFDMGPTFYWMPDVFESFYQDFGAAVSHYYELEKLNPAYKVFFGKNNSISIADNLDQIVKTFESIELGSGKKLMNFIANAKENYELAIKDLVYQPGEKLSEIITLKTIKKLKLFTANIAQIAKTYFKDKRLQQIVTFPVLFLGAKPSKTPAFYNFMNYADFGLGTWHPKGGMYKVVLGIKKLAETLGVEFKTKETTVGLEVQNNYIYQVKTEQRFYYPDIVLSGADYAHTENLLPEAYRQYSEAYWKRKTFAPSALLFYVGFSQPLKNVNHHTLFFDTDFEKHAKTIYDTATWPETPLFYASFPSKTDPTVAPIKHEAGIFLIPIAPDLKDTETIKNKYFNILIQRLEALTNQKLKDKVLFHESYSVSNFKEDYNSYKGNAYGLANTLLQTHYLRPKLKSSKLKNLYFCGQLTVPGPGVPPSIISGKIVSDLIAKYHL